MTVSTPGGDNEEGAGGVTEAGAHALNELKSALELFQPHLCVLVLRHPAVNYASLHSKVRDFLLTCAHRCIRCATHVEGRRFALQTRANIAMYTHRLELLCDEWFGPCC